MGGRTLDDGHLELVHKNSSESERRKQELVKSEELHKPNRGDGQARSRNGNGQLVRPGCVALCG